MEKKTILINNLPQLLFQFTTAVYACDGSTTLGQLIIDLTFR